MIQIIVLLEIGDPSAFIEFEGKASKIMKKYGGEITSAFSPNNIVGEVHVVNFPNLPAFRNYRDDSELKSLKELKSRAIINSEIFVSDKFVDYE